MRSIGMGTYNFDTRPTQGSQSIQWESEYWTGPVIKWFILAKTGHLNSGSLKIPTELNQTTTNFRTALEPFNYWSQNWMVSPPFYPNHLISGQVIKQHRAVQTNTPELECSDHSITELKKSTFWMSAIWINVQYTTESRTIRDSNGHLSDTFFSGFR
jgi:hypothetical protein